jgi:hypothetical protein
VALKLFRVPLAKASHTIDRPCDKIFDFAQQAVADDSKYLENSVIAVAA